MVMNFAVFDTNLHMIHHYRRVNSAKGVVNTSAPRSQQLRYKSVSNLNSRYSTPSLLSATGRILSRPNSNCEVRKRKICNKHITTDERSSSVPPRPCTRRNLNAVPQNFIKTRKPCPKINDNTNSKKIPIRNETPKSTPANSPKHNRTPKQDKMNKQPLPLKEVPIILPVPAPRLSFMGPKKPTVPDYEYLQFSLRITEDIIRNDLYSQKEMRRVFNSHIEANRGRLNMTKMLKQIDHLCKELNISKKVSGNNPKSNKDKQTNIEYCSCKTKDVAIGSTNPSSESSKQDFLKKVVDGQHISEEEINELTETDLQDVITKILNVDPDFCTTCKKSKDTQISAEFVEYFSQNNKETQFSAEIIAIVSKNTEEGVYKCPNQSCPTVDANTNRNTSDYSFHVIHSNVDNFVCESAENLKSGSSYTEESCSMKSSGITNKTEMEEQNLVYEGCECSCKSDTELNQSDNEPEMLEDNPTIPIDENRKSTSSINAYDQLLKSMLQNFPAKLKKDSNDERISEDQLKIIDLCLLDPVCSQRLIKEKNQTDEPNLIDLQKTLERINNKGNTCTLDPICTRGQIKENELIEKEPKQCDASVCFSRDTKESEQNFSDGEESSSDESESSSGNGGGDSCSADPICSGRQVKDTESELIDPICSGRKTKPIKGNLCSLDPVCSKLKIKNTQDVQKSIKENKNADLCLTDPVCSKLKTKNTQDVQESIKENKNADLCLTDPVCSKLKTKITEDVQVSIKEIKRKKMCLQDPVCSKLESKDTEQIPPDAPQLNKEKKGKNLCLKDPICSGLKIKESTDEDKSLLDPICSKQKTKNIEVSIVAHKSAVDYNMDNSASIKSIALDSKTTQTSFTVAENPESVKPSEIDDTGIFYYDNSLPSTSKKKDIEIVYDKDNKSKLDDCECVHSKPKINLSEKRQKKDEFISSITKFVLGNTISSPKPCQSEKNTDFVSTVEKLINDRTKDLYQYSIPEKKSGFKSELPFRISVESLDKYKTEYNKEYCRQNYSKGKASVSSKTSDSTVSEGEILKSTTTLTLTRKLTNKLIIKNEPEILEHLKRYEQPKVSSKVNNSLTPCLCDYEIKPLQEEKYDRYIPKFRKSIFFPTVSTQTSSTDTNFKSGFNDNLLSDGEIQNTSSEADETKTDLSENETFWR